MEPGPLINQKATLKVMDQISGEVHALEKKIRANHTALSRKRKARLAQVRTLHFVEKLTVTELSEHLGVAEITIRQDLAFLKQQALVEAKDDVKLKADMLNFVWEMNENYKERIRSLWKDYKASTNEFVRVKQLAEIREQEKTYIEFLQQFGLVVKEPEKVLHGITYISHLGKERNPAETINQEDPKNEAVNVDDSGAHAAVGVHAAAHPV